MAKKQTLSEALRKDAWVWLGNTNLDNTQILLEIFNNKTHWILVENTEDNLVIKCPKDTGLLSAEIFKTIYEIFPELQHKETGKITTSSLPKKLEVTSDCNQILFDRDIKVLPSTTVKPFLDSLGINITKYEYTKISIDNSHNLTASTITCGYSNYPDVVLENMNDVSKYKNYIVEYPEEEEMLLDGSVRTLIFVGGPGNGKTTEGMIYAAKNEIPCYIFNCTLGSQEDDLVSSFIPNVHDDSCPYLLRRGPVSYALEYGGILLINELQNASAEVQSNLNHLLDDTDTFILDDGTVIRKHPNFRCILTMNPQRGLEIDTAILDRCDTIYWGDLDKDTFISRLTFETGFKNTKFLEALFEKFTALKDIYATKNMKTELSYRRAKSFLTKILLHPNFSYVNLFRQCFVDQVAITDLNDINNELKDLYSITDAYAKELHEVMKSGTDEVKIGSWTCEPGLDDDELDEAINDDGTFADPEEE